MDSQVEGDKPVVKVPEEGASPIPEGEVDIVAADSQSLAIGPIPAPPPAPPVTGVKRYREEPRKFLTRNRIPFTSEKFDLVRYVEKVLRGSSQIYVPYIFRCEFVCNDGTGYPTDFKKGPGAYSHNGKEFDELYKYADALEGYNDKLYKIRGFELKPAFGLIRLVWPSPKGPVHHIIPYLVNTQPGATPDKPVQTIWFLEQYDTTFWWLFNKGVRDWHNELGEAMIGQGHSYIRAYNDAAAEVALAEAIATGKDRSKLQIEYTQGAIKDIKGYAMDLQRSSNGTSAETCVPWSMVILKYIMDPLTIGVKGHQLDPKTANQENFNEMYQILNAKRDDVLKWVMGTISGGNRRKTHRRRRQTRRKTKRSRK